MPNWKEPTFQWDDGNIEHLIDRHGVYPVEAEQVFFNNPYIKRVGDVYYVYGRDTDGRLLFLVCEDRYGKVRIFSAHEMDNQERQLYERNRQRR